MRRAFDTPDPIAEQSISAIMLLKTKQEVDQLAQAVSGSRDRTVPL